MFSKVGRYSIAMWYSSEPTFWEDHLRLDPWHELKTMQPLGESNRLKIGRFSSVYSDLILLNLQSLPDEQHTSPKD